MYESDAKDATSLYVTCLDEDPQKNDLIGDCVINMVRVMDYGEQDGMLDRPRIYHLTTIQLPYQRNARIMNV